MTRENPYASPVEDTAAEVNHSERMLADRRRGRMVVGFIVVGIILWDFVLLNRSDGAVGILLVDLCAAHFMWSGSRLARWYMSVRCLPLGIAGLVIAAAQLDPIDGLLALVMIWAGWSLLVGPTVSRFFAFQQLAKRDILAEKRPD